MLNIGRMAPGSQDYYLHAVAHGVEDYYLGRGEAPGRWLGHGLDPLDLSGEVTGEQLTAVLAGQHPATGETLAAHPARKVPGFDLTFRAPKSVSLLWGLADTEVSDRVQAAHEAAVAAAVGYLQRHAARTRRGAGGVERAPMDGLIGAAFRHRTSRAGDPLLHTHVLIANLARTTDDRVWRTLDSRALFAHAKTAGTLYQAHLRHELTRTLGVGWQPVVNGCADLAGVPRDWIDAFSKRRTAILSEMERRGETSAAAAQVATLATRQAKEHQLDEPDLRARWRTEAARHDIPTDWWRSLLDRHQAAGLDRDELDRQLVGDQELTETASTFTLRDVHAAIAEHAPDGAPVETIEQAARHLLREGVASGQVVRLGPRRGPMVRVDSATSKKPGGEVRFTTRRLLLLEQATLTAAGERLHDQAAVVPAATADRAIRHRPTLSDEQAAMVHRLTTSGAGVEVVVGKAGTGKTYALATARQAWTDAGVRVTGVALAARAALELQDSAGIEATTLTRLLSRLEDPAAPGSPLQPGQVLVVDEAGMIGTRPLARLLTHARRQQAKVVLVGDPRQLPEIDAGGLFTGLATRLPAIELADNRRQTQGWEAGALEQLRHGHVADAIDAYRAHGRIVTAATADAAREQLVSDWWHTVDTLAADQAIMVALRRADVDDLNHRARTRMTATGRLTGPVLRVDEVEFRAGDRIVCLRNDRHVGVVNGTRATITAVRDDHSLQVRGDDGTRLHLPALYLQAGQVAHGYAITGHKAQGLTVDHTFVLATEATYREWGYVALSRGRHTNRLYLHEHDDLDLDGGPHTREPHRDPIATTVARLSRTRAQQPVSEVPGARLARLANWLSSDDVRRARQLHHDRDQAARDREATADRHTRARQGLDRHRGLALTRRARSERATAEQHVARLADRLDQFDRRLADLDTQLTGLPDPDEVDGVLDEYRHTHQQIERQTRRRVLTATHDPPDYLLTTLGRPPTDRTDRERWQKAAHTIESYRTRWGITDPHRPFGHEPTDPVRQQDHHRAATALHEHRRELEREPTRGRSRGLGISLGR